MRPHLATLLADFRRHGRQTAIVTHRGNRSFPCTWEELAEWSARFANELGGRGLREGDRMLIWGDNSAEWMAAFFGCVLRGIAAVPLDAAGSTEFARRVIAEVQPKLIAGSPELLGRLGPGISIPALGFDQIPASLPSPDYRPAAGLSRDSVLQIVFTSGTTADPKGIVHTHGNVLASLDTLEREIGKYIRYERIFHPLRFLHTLPLSHVFGQFMGLWVPPLIAAEVHYESRLEAPRLIRIIRRERISLLAAVPRVLDLLRSHLAAEMPGLAGELARSTGLKLWQRWWRFRELHRRFGFKFWAFVSGGAALAADLEGFWTNAGFALIQGYGMTETTALVTLTNPFKATRGSIGRPLPGREIQIGPDGEILVRGASVADRVWQQGKMQERGKGWLSTGDLVARDAQGELVFTGRKSDVIVTAAGINIHPQDLEAALRRQAHVRDAVVVAYASPSGPSPAAVLILDSVPPSVSREAEAAVAGANRELSAVQQILYSLVWPGPDFPRTSTGKVLRRQVESWVEQSLSAAGSATAARRTDTTDDPLIGLLHRIQPAGSGRQISDSDRLAEDLHLDSLASVELQSAVETRFSAEIDDAAWQQVRTVGELRALLHPATAVAAPSSVPFPAGSPAPLSAPTPPASPAPPGPGQVFARWPWWAAIRALRIGFLEAVVRPLVWLLLAPGIERRGNMPEPSLLIANHVTAIDVPVILYGLNIRDRGRVAVAMSGEMLADWRAGKGQGHRMIGWLMPIAYWLVTALFNVFPLPRRRGLRQSFDHAGEALDRGYHVLVFPEGGRSADGRLRAFEPGIGLLARESQAMVRPIYITGLGALKLRPKSWSPRFWFRPGPVTVRLGEPLAIAPEEDPAHFARRLQAAVLDLGRGGPAHSQS